MSLFYKTLVISALSCISAFTLAADKGAYWGGGLGVGNGDCTGCNIDTGFGMRVYGGYQFNQYFGAEGGFGFVQTTENYAGMDYTYVQKVFDLSAIASLPLSDNFSIFARGGYAAINMGGEVDTGSGTAKLNGGSNPGAIFGFGLTYKLASDAKLRFEYTTMGKESSHYDANLGYEVLDTIDASMTTISYQGWF